MMEIVIKIPNNAFKNGICEGDTDRIVRAIVDYVGCCSAELLNILNTAIPLPKGHGDLIDRSKLNITDLSPDPWYSPQWGYSEWEIDDADVVVEADKEEQNERLD